MSPLGEHDSEYSTTKFTDRNPSSFLMFRPRSLYFDTKKLENLLYRLEIDAVFFKVRYSFAGIPFEF